MRDPADVGVLLRMPNCRQHRRQKLVPCARSRVPDPGERAEQRREGTPARRPDLSTRRLAPPLWPGRQAWGRDRLSRREKDEKRDADRKRGHQHVNPDVPSVSYRPRRYASADPAPALSEAGQRTR